MTGMTTSRIPLLEVKGEELSRALGVLSVTTSSGRVTLPLAKVEIRAHVAERIAEVTVTEVFRNTYTENLEAVYIFPLAGGGAVSSFELQVKDRIIKGKVEERAEARKQYQQALAEGKRAALLEKERDDVFTVQVGNLPPGEEVTVRITYSERLPFFENGTTELRLPLVVAPRYIPGSPLERDSAGHGTEGDTDIVPDASRITPPRLAEGLDPKVTLGINVELKHYGENGDSGILDLSCSQHATQSATELGVTIVELVREDERLNRDFVLRWRLAGEKVRSSLLTYSSPEGETYGVISLIPPQRKGFLGVPRDIVFVLDRSGSMEGPKMASAARACSQLLATLEPRDRFAIQAFDNVTEWMKAGANSFIQADEAGIEQGNRFLRSITARGGTELDMAMQDALRAIKQEVESGHVPTIVLITDGEIGDEGRVLKRIQTELGDSRVFTVGIDTAVNEGFLKRLAGLGGGTSAFVTPGENLEKALLAIGREIGSPLILDVAIEDVDSHLTRDSLSPERIPDLFAGRATTAYFMIGKKGRIRVRGKYGDGKTFEKVLSAKDISLPAVAHLWARSRIADLEDHFRIDAGRQAVIKRDIVDLSKKHSILSRFTAFIIVDETEIVNEDGSSRTVVQPVEMPDRWEMEMGGRVQLKGGAMPMGYGAGARGMKMPQMSAPPPPSPARPGLISRSISESMPRSSIPEPRDAMSFGSPDINEFSAPGECLSLDAANLCESKADMFFEPPEMLPIGRMSPQSPPKTAREREDRATGKPLMKREKMGNDVGKAFEIFEKALKDAYQEIKAGRLPSSAALEKARKALLSALAHSDQAEGVPLLQKFLRVSATELVAALDDKNASVSSLAAFFEGPWSAFEEVRKEFSGLSSASGADNRNNPFWEGSI
jgi:Ca-activated chloride channel homolog